MSVAVFVQTKGQAHWFQPATKFSIAGDQLGDAAVAAVGDVLAGEERLLASVVRGDGRCAIRFGRRLPSTR